jgi:hypothetical protein
MAWSAHASTGSVTPAAPPHYTFNRWRYVPSKNAFITVNSIDQNVFIYKLDDSKPQQTRRPSQITDTTAK